MPRTLFADDTVQHAAGHSQVPWSPLVVLLAPPSSQVHWLLKARPVALPGGGRSAADVRVHEESRHSLGLLPPASWDLHTLGNGLPTLRMPLKVPFLQLCLNQPLPQLRAGF